MPDLRYPIHESLFFHNSLASIIAHNLGYVRIEWHPTLVRTSDLREAYEHVLLLLKDSGITKVLSDHQLLAAIMPDDQYWLVNNWVPRAVREGGYSRCAIIQAYDVISHLATLKVTNSLATPLAVNYFDDQRQAEGWLLQA
ncbi:hypothetical protein [Hymenobacter crusticola]|uniref:STAS/SEC14 domain-containing protein n=1 Tax=Hymenobacter crusticola TaxID=1770526 RepID=A0A243WFP9_9BACT|nr:hypothetical protein [Hymenobacter crusticola]OUJ74606.1 hypothetical protein BXP70_07475 [Hymenobacter crusticola]